MALKYLIIFSLLSLYEAQEGYDFQSFVNMIRSNITAAANFQYPSQNEELGQVSGDEPSDFGEFDFIIVGGGSAGTLMANRLSEINNWKILLLEAGGDENDWSGIPGATLFLQSSPMNWGYFTTPQKTCCQGMRNNSCVAPRGKVLGGSSVINVKMYVRCNKEDYNRWGRLVDRSWDYRNIFRYFIKTENTSITNGDAGYHSTKGLLHVQYIDSSQFTKPYINGLRELGIPELDYNGRNQLGTSRIQFTINGLKISSGGRAFIYPIRNIRNNLKVVLNAFVTKIRFNDKTAEGVEFVNNGKRYRARASKEVILSAGAYNSPQVLMLSGIGPRKHLESLGIEVIQDLPVGRELYEHLLFPGLIIRTNKPPFNESLETTVKDYLQGKRPWVSPVGADCTTFRKVGNDQSRTFLSGLFGQNRDQRPNIQHILLVPPGFVDMFAMGYNYNDEITESINKNYNSSTDLLLYLVLLHPKSYGSVTLKSANPIDFPNIDYNMLSDSNNDDLSTVYDGIQDAFRLLDTQEFRNINATFVPIVTGCGDYSRTSRRYWDCAIRMLSSTIYHPMGTTRMGSSPSNSVVTSDGRVHGIRRLRVVDAGIMPEIPSGNLNAVVYMMTEKISDDIKRQYRVL